jgi:hypothetical protein
MRPPPLRVHAVARGHRKIIRVPHKPGMIARWPFPVTPPRPRSRSRLPY